MPVSLLVLGGLSVPPPDFYRSLRPRPDNKVGKVTQVNRAVVQEGTHSAQVSWFISLPREQSLYPGRPRGGLTIVPSRYPFEYRPSAAEGFVAQYPLKCWVAVTLSAVPPPLFANRGSCTPAS